MHFIAETTADGVSERLFTLGDVTGVLWTPADAPGPRPLILLGHGGGQHKLAPGMVGCRDHPAQKQRLASRPGNGWPGWSPGPGAEGPPGSRPARAVRTAARLTLCARESAAIEAPCSRYADRASSAGRPASAGGRPR